jgi:hypothetical protein
MGGGTNWTLTIPDNGGSSPVYNSGSAVTANQWGTPYAVAFNMTVTNCTASSGYVAAASDVSASAGPDTSHHHRVLSAGTNPNWNFGAPCLTAVETVSDNVLHLSFSQGIENSNDEINTLIGSITTNSGASAFTGAFSTAACTTAVSDGATDFYIRTSASWNTDATGTSAGAALSTNRAGTHCTVVPNLSMALGVLRASNGHAFVRDYTTASHVYDGSISGTSHTDRCAPVLIGATYGQAAHSLTSSLPYDGHNYLQLQYSEAVNFTSLTANAADTSTVTNTRGSASWGALTQNGGNLQFAGLVSVAGTVANGSRDGNSVTEGLYRDTTVNAYGDHGLYVSLAGYSVSGSYRFWPGYFTALSAPSGTVSPISNAGLVDASGNAIDAANSSLTVTVAPIGSGWDVDRPYIPIDDDGYYAVIPMATLYKIDRVELMVRQGANQAESLRDSSFGYGTAAAFPTVPSDAFLLRDVDNDPAGTFYPTGSSFSTEVSSKYFAANSISITDDGYIAIAFGSTEGRSNWTARSQFYFQYNSDLGRITDLAGNLLASYMTTTNPCIEKVPPKIRLSSAIVGQNKVYVQFTEPVQHIDGTDVQASDFTFSNSGLSVASLSVLSKNASGLDKEVMLTLAGTITGPDILSGTFGPTLSASAALIMDRSGNVMDPTYAHRISDFGLGLIDTQTASDGVHVGTNVPTGGLGALRVFDGTGKLYDRNITVSAALDASLSTSLPVSMYFDVGPSSTTYLDPTIVDSSGTAATLPIWQPTANADLFGAANTEARLAGANNNSGPTRSFLIPGGDSEIVTGAKVEFLYKVADLYCYRVVDSSDPTKFDLYRFSVQDFTKQRGGVTIRNNVIDPTVGERAALQVVLANSGFLTIQVFTLDGDLVKVLTRTQTAAGTFFYTWDGTNEANRAVARGLYFIRVVGPGIDEIRKVMVVKPR